MLFQINLGKSNVKSLIIPCGDRLCAMIAEIMNWFLQL